MKTNKFFYLVIILFLVHSCGNDEYHYKEYFDKNQIEFIEMKNYIDSAYINKISSKNLIFLDCDNFEVNSFIKEKCDKNLTKIMSKVNIDRVEVEHYYRCEHSTYLNKISFRVFKDEYYPLVYIVYEYCKNDKRYISNTFEKHSLGNNWYYTIDKNVP